VTQPQDFEPLDRGHSTVDRPPWSALSAMIGDLKKAWGGVSDVQRQMLAVTGVAWSDDGFIKVVVGPRGHLMELEIDPRVYRTPNAKLLSDTILATVRVAIEDVGRQSKEILDASVPVDLRVGVVGDFDIGKLITSHDADIRDASSEREGDRRG
jgi:DNA-binding protein YbaB